MYIIMFLSDRCWISGNSFESYGDAKHYAEYIVSATNYCIYKMINNRPELIHNSQNPGSIVLVVGE